MRLAACHTGLDGDDVTNGKRTSSRRSATGGMSSPAIAKAHLARSPASSFRSSLRFAGGRDFLTRRVDEEVAISAGGWQGRSFTISSPRPIQVVAEGKTHTDKGFSVYVMSSSEVEQFRQRAGFRHIEALQGLKVRSLSRTAMLAPGAWTVIVANTENIINGMVVRLRIVSDPGT